MGLIIAPYFKAI
jgi:hypothetical protein